MSDTTAHFGVSQSGIPKTEEINEKCSDAGTFKTEVSGEDTSVKNHLNQETAKKKRKEKKKGSTLKGFFCGVLVSGCVFFAYQHFVANAYDKEQVLRDCIDRYYLGEVDEEALQEGVYKGLVAALGDPYSEYFTEEENTVRTQEYEGSYKGIGVLLQQDTETGMVTIVSCYDGSPAQEAGIQDGDILYMVNGELVADKELSDSVAVIKSAGDEGVDLTLIREGQSEYIEVNVVPNDVIYPVVAHEMMEDGIGYLAISEFKESTYQQFHDALEDLKGQDMKGLVVDLRNNTGGLLDSVNNILGGILPEGTMVYTIDKNGEREDYMSKGETPLEVPMVVLVNGYTASASEIFAGAVRDYDMAKLVGTQTYGKGVVQSSIRLSDGSALKLTIANYYTPNGTNINGTGLTPDEVVELDTMPQEDGTYVDNQLERGVEVLREMLAE